MFEHHVGVRFYKCPVPAHQDELASLIGNNVRKLRIAVQAPPASVAAALGMSLVEYFAMEGGERRLTAEQLVDLCELLETMPSAFFDERLQSLL